MVVVTPREGKLIYASGFGDQYGIMISVNMAEGQKWNARRAGHYWTLTKKGSPVRLRLTDSALEKHFIISKENNQ